MMTIATSSKVENMDNIQLLSDQAVRLNSAVSFWN